MRGKLNIKLFGDYAQVFIGKQFVGSITYDTCTFIEHDGWTEHFFKKDGVHIATIYARGDQYGTHFTH